MNSREIVQKMLDSADIKINGERPWDIQVHNEKLYDRILSKGTLGIGESYMDGWWDCEALDEMIYRVLRFSDRSFLSKNLTNLLLYLKSQFFNLQTKSEAKKVTNYHYDISDDLYMSFLDPYSQYTCAYFKDTTDLNKAQENKMDLICRKIQLKSTDRVLDLGCGWGGLAKWMAEKHGCRVIGINLAKGQVEYVQKHISNPLVEIINMDYRDVGNVLKGKFDKVVSIGMMEHVGYKNYRKMLKIVRKYLKEDGIFLLHTIGGNNSVKSGNAWLNKYIFPNGMLPSVNQISRSCEGLFVLEDWHNFGAYYDLTLMAWYKNFDKSWPKLKDRYSERFYRMFRYYLLLCAGSFRAREMELWQIVLSPKGVLGGYTAVR